MTNPIRRVLVPFFLVFGSLLLAACSGGNGNDKTPTAPVISVAGVQVSLPAQSLYVGATIQATVVVKDQNGNAMVGQAVSWSTSDATKATVSSTGLVTGVGIGTVTITAAVGTHQGTVSLIIAQVPVARVVISPPTSTIQPWQSVHFSAIALDSAGNQLANRTVSWTSSDSLRAPVDSQGTVTANLLGSITVTASIGGQAASALVNIALPSTVTVGPNIDIDPSLQSSETSVAINPTNPLNIIASANWAHFASFDGGRTWNYIAVASNGTANGDPNVAFNRQGVGFRQGLGWEITGPRGVVVQSSNDGGRTLNHGVYAYQPVQGRGAPDQGILAIDTVAKSPYVGNLYVTAADYQSAGYLPAYPSVGFPMIVLTSHDGGKTWDSPIDISDSPSFDQENSEYVTTGENGEVYVAWVKIAAPGSNAQHVVFTRSLDGGRTWSANTVIHALPLPGNSYTTNVRGNITIDVDRSNGPNRGTVYLSSLDFNGPAGGGADAWVMRSTDGGSTWSNPVLLSDAPRGPNTYNFQPRISVAPNGRVDAAWYGITNWDGQGIPSYNVYYSYSTDGALTFSPSIRVTTVTAPKPAAVFGEYMGLTSDSTRALVTWSDMRNGLPDAPHAYFAVVWNAQMPSKQTVRSVRALGKTKQH
ncbi:MAG: Ig-like domain-containing protein [Gemmatimonadaceae bacterium]